MAFRSRWLFVFAAACLAPDLRIASAAELTHGPMIGHITSTTATVWARFSSPGEYELRVFSADNAQIVPAVTAVAVHDNDLTLRWQVSQLRPATRYRYEISAAQQPRGPPGGYSFRTPHDDQDERVVRLAFGSCAWDVSHPRQRVWSDMASSQVDAVVLLGDTPYIDSTDLHVQRRRYREFWSIPELKDLIWRTSFYAVWDDHDFGPDNALGLIPGKANSRRAFVEYHANPSYGETNQGIYTRFRRGPVEVFLLDTRWFANTEASPVNPERKTLMGASQWEWLKRSLRESRAPVKVLACGMIWNEAVYPGKVDCWMAYPYEREGLFQHLRAADVGGVILVGGDIHRSRHFLHPTRERVGYDLHEFITSPLAEETAPYNDIPSPYLKFDAELRDSFLLLTVSSTQEATHIQGDFVSQGQVRHSVKIDRRDLGK
jgi:alkaline phosphatase D